MADPSAFPYYPVHDFGPAMKGMVIGGLGIVHVFLAQFAIGGGMLLCYLEWLGQRRREPDARRFVDGMFRTLVLISFVAGALTGVGMWFTSIQVGARPKADGERSRLSAASVAEPPGPKGCTNFSTPR